MIDVEYKGAAYREGDDGWVRDMVQDISINIAISDEKLIKISEVVRAGVESNIYNQREYLGAPAAPNAPSTVARKGHSIVYLDTGLLRQSIREKAISKSEREIYIAPERNLVAKFLQYGTSRMPARPFFGVSDEILEKIKQIVLTN